MAEQKESSVLFSLQELMNLEKSRVLEEEQDRKHRLEAEARARLDAEQRVRDAEQARLHAEENRRRDDELRRRLEDAQIEAAKLAEIEARRLEQQHLLEMAALAKQREHEKEIQQIAAARPKGLPRSVLATVVAAMVAALFAVIFIAFVQPVQAAKEAVKRAEIASASDDPAQWDVADGQIAIARDKDPTNKDIPLVAAKVKGKRDALQAKKDAADAENAQKLKSLQDEVAKKQKELDGSKTEADRKALEKDIAKLQGQIKATPPPAAAPASGKVCKDVPGCPLCPKICK